MDPAAAVVVGVDGSASATAAAVWAIDEAAQGNVPLRLVHVVDLRVDRRGTTRAVAAGAEVVDAAMRCVVDAQTHCGAHLTVEGQIVTGDVVAALRELARDARVLCIGSSGSTHGGVGHVGSVAAALARLAPCPLAVIRRSRQRPGFGAGHEVIVAEVSESCSGKEALALGVGEALLRGLPLRVVTSWSTQYPDVCDGSTATVLRMTRTELDRRLVPWRDLHPGLDVSPVAVHGNVVNYLAQHRDEIALAVVPHERGYDIAELGDAFPPASHRDLCFDMLICAPDSALSVQSDHPRTSRSEHRG